MRTGFIFAFILPAIIFSTSLSAQVAPQSTDAPLLSQGAFVPPPPPPGYSVNLPPMEPFTAPPPPPPAPPEPVAAPSQGIAPEPVRPAMSAPLHMQLISPELAKHVARLMSSIKTYRTVVDAPESDVQLRRILNTARICSDMLGLQRFPVPSKFVVGPRDRVLRDRSHKAVEYRFFGDFDNRLNGWIKPIETAVYIDLIFDGKSRRRNHIRAQITRTGPVTGYFYAYSWDAFGNQWKLQGSLDNVFVRDNGMPSGGELKVFGADPHGHVMKLELSFPVKVAGEPEPVKKDTRHREGKRVSIGN